MKFILRQGDPARERILGNARQFLAMLGKDRSWQVEVREWRKTRSSEQNRYLWGVAYARLAEATGQPADDWHEYMLGEHYGWETVELFGRRKLRPMRRSSNMTTAEFSAHVEFIRARAAEFGIYIPDPNEE